MRKALKEEVEAKSEAKEEGLEEAPILKKTFDDDNDGEKPQEKNLRLSAPIVRILSIYSNECKFPKNNKSKKDEEKVNVAEGESDGTSLLMEIEKSNNVVLTNDAPKVFSMSYMHAPKEK